MPTNDPPQPEPLNTTGLTWTAMLGRWVEFARSALALPDTDEGHRMRASVGDIIMLQAVWFALQHLEDLSKEEAALGIDRAGVLIEKHETALRDCWPDPTMPDLLKELIADAREQLACVSEDRD